MADPVRIAVVTATRDRLALLQRLGDSLRRQVDRDFVWVVIDDAGSDGSDAWVRSRTESDDGFETVLLVNEAQAGKCASLNRAFESVEVDFYLIVDSDDRLADDGIEAVRAKAAEYADAADIGALFFAYEGPDGVSLGSAAKPGLDVVLTRAEHDARFGKYDGCVGYFRRTVDSYHYPEFDDETYIGPTVLQLLMAPRYRIAFTDTIVGVAEYQPGGLTAAGRALRVRNPLGMMTYTRLRAEQAAGLREAAEAAAMFHAYRRIAGVSRRGLRDRGLPDRAGRVDTVGLIIAPLLARVWRRHLPTRRPV